MTNCSMWFCKPGTLTHFSPVEVILAAKEMLAAHRDRLEVVLVLVLEVLHFLHIHANLHPRMMRVSSNQEVHE